VNVGDAFQAPRGRAKRYHPILGVSSRYSVILADTVECGSRLRKGSRDCLRER
jgi:hypothetical protein